MPILWLAIEAANAEANPELFRIALKMATGAGKTTVMAMIIAWQTLNAVRMPGFDRFSRAFLIVTPGITIKDRLQVLYPEHPESYYRARELLPNDISANRKGSGRHYQLPLVPASGDDRAVAGRARLPDRQRPRAGRDARDGRQSLTAPAASCCRSRISSSSMTRRITATANERSPKRRGSTARARPRPGRTARRRGCGSAASRR